MASVSTYLNFTRDCEAAFKFYRIVYGTTTDPCQKTQ